MASEQLTLIQEQLTLINSNSNSPHKLHSILYDMQLDPIPEIPSSKNPNKNENVFTNPETIIISLQISIAASDLVEFQYGYERNIDKLIKNETYGTLSLFLKNIAELVSASKYGNENSLKKLLAAVKDYISNRKELGKVREDILIDGLSQFILGKIRRNYRDYEVERLHKDYNIKKEWLKLKGYNINNGYVTLEEENKTQNYQQTLQHRMKQVTKLTEHIIALGK